MPDYGKLLAYRSPGGLGIRLDGGMGYSGAVITPFYDSMLVKVIASGRTIEMAMDTDAPGSLGISHPGRQNQHTLC